MEETKGATSAKEAGNVKLTTEAKQEHARPIENGAKSIHKGKAESATKATIVKESAGKEGNVAKTNGNGSATKSALLEKSVISVIIYFVFSIIVLGPLVMVLLVSFTPNIYQGVSPTTLKWYEAILVDAKYYNPLIRTFEIAVVTLLIQLVVGTTIAYITVRKKVFFAEFLDSASNITIALPSVVIGLALIAFYGKYGPVAALHQLVFGDPTTIMWTFWIIVLAHVLETFPYMVRSVSSVLVKLDTNVEMAARTLGGTRAHVLRTITIPQLMPGIISGSVLTVSRSIAEFGATIVVASALLKTAPVSIYSEAEMGRLEIACAYSVILMAVSFFIHYILARKVLKEYRSE